MNALAFSAALTLALTSASAGQHTCSGFTMTETPAPPVHRRRQSVTSPAGSYRAFVVCQPLAAEPEVCQDRIFVEDLAVGSVLELRADCFLPWRPFSNLSWSADTVLQFVQWANPSFGHRFEVNVKARQLVRAQELVDASDASPSPGPSPWLDGRSGRRPPGAVGRQHGGVAQGSRCRINRLPISL